MLQLWVKICGMTTLEAIAAAADAGADAVGFVFYAASPRHLTIEQAVELRIAFRAACSARVTCTGARAGARVISAMRPDCVRCLGTSPCSELHGR
jgi:phosphoribosylanthranilate isomerase